MTSNQIKKLLILLCLQILGCNFADNLQELDFLKRTNFRFLEKMSGPNVLPISVNGSSCSNSYVNKPCVSVTICNPQDETQCQTIDDILLDTGSFGFRVFKSSLMSNIVDGLIPILSNGSPVGECIEFVDGTSLWGSVQTATIILGDEPSVQTPIQVVDINFGNQNKICNGATPDEKTAGFNGILGVGALAQDCGIRCVYQTFNGNYYSCQNQSCIGTTMPIANQVQNPVTLLPVDFNGLSINLPSISTVGEKSIDGYLVLGIGTQTNNIPTEVTTYFAKTNSGELTTQFNQKNYPSFLDTGSNGIYFPQPASDELPICQFTQISQNAWYCPSRYQILKAAMNQNTTQLPIPVFFQIGNFNSLMSSNNNVFLNIGGTLGRSTVFYWGLPFFIGRQVFLGFQGTSSNLGVGPYWAY